METIDKIINLDHLNSSNISISRALLLFYLFIANSYTQELYSGQLSDFIKDNRFAKHIIGYITMLVIIMSIGGVTNLQTAALYTSIAYVWFLMTTKLDLQWSLLIIGLLLIGYMSESNMVDREKIMAEDQALDKYHCYKIKMKHYGMKRIIMLSILGVTIIGTMFYFIKKQGQYQNNFDALTFMFGGRQLL